MDKIAVAIIIVAAIILLCRVWYHEGYRDALKDARNLLNDKRKEKDNG